MEWSSIFPLAVAGPSNLRPEIGQLPIQRSTTSAVVPSSVNVERPIFRSVIGHGRKSGTGSNETVSVKIKKADKSFKNGKLELITTNIAYCHVTESTANVNSINAFIREEFGENYLLAGTDGLEIRDQSGTRDKCS